MRSRTILLTILAIVLVFGTMIAGCKRDNRTAANTRGQSPERQTRRGVASRDRSVRPAEVLSAATPRHPQMDGTAYLVQDYPSSGYYDAGSSISAQTTYAALPPVNAGPVYSDPTPVYATTSSPYSTYYPEYAGYVGYNAAPPQVTNTPELAMAKATLPSPPPPAVVSQPVHSQPTAKVLPPIPELEPVQYRAPSGRKGNARPAAEIMMSDRAKHQEIRRALAPIGPADATQGWVSSPATAMRF